MEHEYATRKRLEGALESALYRQYSEKSQLRKQLDATHLINQTLNFNGTVGAVQTGSKAVANIDQKMGVDVSSIIAVINELKQQVQELPEATRDEASDALELIDDELAGTRDKKRIRVAFNWLKTNVSGSVDFASRLAVLAKHLNDMNIFDR